MDLYIKLNSQTAGKDKIARLIQYFSKTLWYIIQRSNFNPYVVDKIKMLEYMFSTFRKLLRLGKSVEVFYAALKAVHCDDAAIRLTSTMSKISNAIFLLADHILWMGRSGLATVDTSKWSTVSNKYWLMSILLNLARDAYEISNILKQRKLSVSAMPFPSLQRSVKIMESIARYLALHRKDIFWDTIKNLCDVWIPLTSLGFTKLSPGLVGFLGTVSSVAGLMILINPEAKLVPP